MFVQIVKMSFDENKIEEFLTNFHQIKEKIRNFDGCQFLELYQDKNNKNVFFTYSHWNSEQDLNNYRNSKLFIDVWSKTRTFFSDKPEAWSVDKLVSMK